MQLDADINDFERCLQSRPEVQQLAHARRELAFAVYAAATGLYGHAFAGLRVFIELSFAAVAFSVDELKRRRWLANRVNFSWSAALDANEGLLTKNFVLEFNAAAAVEVSEYAEKAARAYRDCSEFMHGKHESTRLLPTTLSFASPMLEQWCRTATDGAEAVLFLLYCRYGIDLLRTDFETVSTPLEHSFSHLVSVRRALDLPIEHGGI